MNVTLLIWQKGLCTCDKVKDLEVDIISDYSEGLIVDPQYNHKPLYKRETEGNLTTKEEQRCDNGIEARGWSNRKKGHVPQNACSLQKLEKAKKLSHKLAEGMQLSRQLDFSPMNSGLLAPRTVRE